MIRLENYTPHVLLTYRADGREPIELPQRGNARLSEEYMDGGWLPGGLPLTLVRYGQVSGLPDPAPGAVYVVSQLVVETLPDRDDVCFPAGMIRDDDGTIIGFRHLARPVTVGVRPLPTKGRS